MQATILATMFVALESGKITSPLSPNLPAAQNMAYIQDFLLNLLKTAFPHLNEPQIKLFIEGLFSFDQDFNAFKEHLRDFLVQIREFAGEDMSDLFLEEREIAIRQAQDEKRSA
nr:hypothetical protein BaRGS_007028 [Batillaria attramentaria]